MTYMDTCIEEIKKRAVLPLWDDVSAEEKMVIIDNSIHGLIKLGEKSIRTHLGQFKGLTCSDYAEFSISSTYWFIKIQQGVFPNVLESENEVIREQDKAKQSKDKAKRAIHQLKKAITAMTAAMSSFPLGHDGDDEYAQMFARWNATVLELQKDIQKQEELRGQLDEYQKMFSTRQQEFVFIVNKSFQSIVTRAGGEFVISKGKDSKNDPVPLVRFMVAISGGAFSEGALCREQQHWYDIERGKSNAARCRALLQFPTRQ